ncbi:MAG: cytochrome c maturation protein CcmE [Dehalococcoidia bacterium]|nr:cytochrome c maturation protein CcmE [Dehalococcoidia bacterium]
MKRKSWLIITAAVITAAAAFFVVLSMAHSDEGVITIRDVTSQQGDSTGNWGVKGSVSPGSIAWDGPNQVMKFAFSDHTGKMNVIYRGTVPDSFKPGTVLTITGRYRQDGMFEASSLGRERSLCAICH